LLGFYVRKTLCWPERAPVQNLEEGYNGYILVFKPTLTLPNGTVKGNVDAELVLHTMIEYPNYSKALIVTGDGDFYCLVDYLIKHDKLLKLMIPDEKRFSSLFRKLMSHIVFMNNLKGKLEYKGK
jgi:uncharacterized LabA/DUF88 family protein